MIVFDLDGTLSIVGDRLKHLVNKDWDSFYEACGEDKPNIPVVGLFKTLHASDFALVIVTGRRESVRGKTIKWLKKHGMYDERVGLLMRPDGDKRHDTIVKIELVQAFIDDIEMVFEDRNSMVAEWRKHGITALQVAEGDF